VLDILSFERLESGKVELMKEPCQVEDLMRQAEDSVQSLADKAAVILIVHPLQATCYTAPDGIVQVLTNLLSNAIKFSNAGGKVVLEAKEWVGMRVEECEGESVSGAGYQVSGTQNQLSPNAQNPKSKTHPPIHP